MAIITAGYDGTVDEVQFAGLLHRYAVIQPEDFKATTQAGDRIVSIADGTALGPGTVDTATGLAPIQFAAAAANTTRWDLVALRRNWQPPGGASEIVIIQGSSSMAYPAEGTAATDWNRRPGIMDDQPLYLQEVIGTLLGARIDLRVWAGSDGLFAKHDLVRSYMDRIGTEIDINGIPWKRKLGDNDAPTWERGDEVGKLPLFGAGAAVFGGAPAAGTQFLVQAGSKVGKTDTQGYTNVVFPTAFPNGLLCVQLSNGDSAIDRAYGRGTLVMAPAGAPYDNGNKSQVSYSVAFPTGLAPGLTHRVNWIAIGW